MQTVADLRVFSLAFFTSSQKHIESNLQLLKESFIKVLINLLKKKWKFKKTYKKSEKLD